MWPLENLLLHICLVWYFYWMILLAQILRRLWGGENTGPGECRSKFSFHVNNQGIAGLANDSDGSRHFCSVFYSSGSILSIGHMSQTRNKPMRWELLPYSTGGHWGVKRWRNKPTAPMWKVAGPGSKPSSAGSRVCAALWATLLPPKLSKLAWIQLLYLENKINSICPNCLMRLWWRPDDLGDHRLYLRKVAEV